MNPGEIITTEINTEIKVEVQLETANIIKVETKAISSIENSEPSLPHLAIEMPTKQECGKEKTRDEIKAEREAKKLAKQAKKSKSGGVSSADNSQIPTNVKAENVNNTASSNLADGTDKTREQIKAEREAKKLAKQAAKTTKAGGVGVAAVTEQFNQVKINETNAKNSSDVVNSADVPSEDTVCCNLV